MAAIASSPGTEIAVKLSNKMLKVYGKLFGKLDESFAIRRGDVDFLNYLNTWIRFYENSGWLEKERKYWFKDLKWVEKP